jgi:hypothetical protein
MVSFSLWNLVPSDALICRGMIERPAQGVESDMDSIFYVIGVVVVVLFVVGFLRRA